MFKIAVFVAFLAVVCAIHQDDHQQDNLQYEHHHVPHYEFGYSVEDKHTGDIKSQHESRQGDQVKGAYVVVDKDGHQRTVEYHANKHDGFNANFNREHTLHVSHDHHGHAEVTGQSSHYQNSLHQHSHDVVHGHH